MKKGTTVTTTERESPVVVHVGELLATHNARETVLDIVRQLVEENARLLGQRIHLKNVAERLTKAQLSFFVAQAAKIDATSSDQALKDAAAVLDAASKEVNDAVEAQRKAAAEAKKNAPRNPRGPRSTHEHLESVTNPIGCSRAEIPHETRHSGSLRRISGGCPDTMGWISGRERIILGVVAVDRAFRPYKRRALTRAELRARCEAARLEMRALFRALDRHRLLWDLPPDLRTAMELDADLAEALWVLGQPRGDCDLRAMERDTLASLERVPAVRDRVLQGLGEKDRSDLLECVTRVRAELVPEDAYLDVPGRDPRAG